MEALFACCCGKFIRGDDECTAYYERIGVAPGCTAAALKSAYRKASLKLHPDKLAQRGQTLTDEDRSNFQKMQAAYEVLSDPRKRQIYDRLGEQGVTLLDNPQAVDPKKFWENFAKSSTSDRLGLVLLVLVVIAVLAAPFLLFCLRADGTDTLTWAASLSPIWMIDVVLVLASASTLPMRTDVPPEGVELEEGEEWHDPMPFKYRFLSFLSLNALVALQATVVVQLDSASLGWSVALLPWAVYEVLSFVSAALRVADRPSAKDLAAEPTTHAQAAAHAHVVERAREADAAGGAAARGVARATILLLACLRLEDAIDWSWWAVLAPLWAMLLLQFCQAGAQQAASRGLEEAAKRDQAESERLVQEASSGGGGDAAAKASALHQQAEHKAQASQLLSAEAISGCVSTCCLSFVVVLGAVRTINGSDAGFSYFVVLLPVFVVLGCCGFCALCAVLCASPEGHHDDDEAAEGAAAGAGAGGGAAAPVPSDDEIDGTLGVAALRALIERAGLSHDDCVEKAELKVRARDAAAKLRSGGGGGGGSPSAAAAPAAAGGGGGAGMDVEQGTSPLHEPLVAGQESID